MSIKILRKNDRKKSFLAKFFNKFVKKIWYNLKTYNGGITILNKDMRKNAPSCRIKTITWKN